MTLKGCSGSCVLLCFSLFSRNSSIFLRFLPEVVLVVGFRDDVPSSVPHREVLITGAKSWRSELWSKMATFHTLGFCGFDKPATVTYAHVPRVWKLRCFLEQEGCAHSSTNRALTITKTYMRVIENPLKRSKGFPKVAPTSGNSPWSFKHVANTSFDRYLYIQLSITYLMSEHSRAGSKYFKISWCVQIRFDQGCSQRWVTKLRWSRINYYVFFCFHVWTSALLFDVSWFEFG